MVTSTAFGVGQILLGILHVVLISGTSTMAYKMELIQGTMRVVSKAKTSFIVNYLECKMMIFKYLKEG